MLDLSNVILMLWNIILTVTFRIVTFRIVTIINSGMFGINSGMFGARIVTFRYLLLCTKTQNERQECYHTTKTKGYLLFNQFTLVCISTPHRARWIGLATTIRHM